MLTFLLTEQILLAYVLLQELRGRFWTLVVFLLIIAVTCLVTSTIGLMCSALARRTSVAMVLTYMSLLILFVLPLGLGWYLQGISSVSKQRLAVLTITSPFSAALSVPMHTTRNEAWTGQTLPIEETVWISITPDLKLPVWAIFLIMYPPLCLFFFWVTYVVFRVRWWRSGGLG